MIWLILACLSIGDIVANYYGDDSFRIAAADTTELCMEGFNRQLAYNRIARANYKHQNYTKALRFARKVQTGREQLYYDTMSLEALLLKNLGKLNQSEAVFNKLLSSDYNNRQILYEAHLNYADLLRLQMQYGSREQHLLQALSYGEGWERNKVIRVLSRHYMDVFRDLESARQILQDHSQPHNPEDRAGYLMVRAELAEFESDYERARRYYQRSATVAKQAGFMGFVYDASDGYMRVTILSQQSNRKRVQWYIINGILLLIFAGFALYNFYYGESASHN